MQAQQIPIQDVSILEILESGCVEVESTCDELPNGCSAESDFGLVNDSTMVIEVAQDSEPVPAVAISSDDDKSSSSPKRKRKYKDSSCGTQAKFKDKHDILQMLLNSTSDIFRVPNETEEKCFAIIDQDNVSKNLRLCRKQAFSIDANIGWDFSSFKRHRFILRDKVFEHVQKLNGAYYFSLPSSQHIESTDNCTKMGRRLRNRPKHNKNVIKLLKQPSNEEILTLCMVYASIGELKRRISYIEKFPSHTKPKQENLIISEYSSLPNEGFCAKVPKLNDTASDRSSRQRDRQSKLKPQDSGISEDVENIIAGVTNKETVAANDFAFLDKNYLIEKHLEAQTTLDEIPAGKKENEMIIIKNDENVRRVAEGKKRVYEDDCGIWRNISVKKRLFVKVDGKYENVNFANGKYYIVNAAVRSHNPTIKKSDILTMFWVYARLRRDEKYRRRISWIESFPKGVEPQQKNIAIAEYIGKYPGTSDAPHGNQKKAGGNPYVRTSSKLMRKMKEQLVSKTASEVVADDPGLQSTPQLKKKLENLRYRNSLRVAPGCVGSVETMQDLVSLVQHNPYVQQVTFIKKKSPLVIAYTPENIKALKSRLSKQTELGVMGVDCTLTIGPLYLTIITYLHPNLLCRYTGLQAVMLGPVLLHIDRSIQAYSSFFNHIKDEIGSYGPNAFQGITLALGGRNDQPLLQALDSCFPSSKIGHCVEHLENELNTFLISEIGLARHEVDHITDELFSRLMSCKDEFDFDTRVTHLQAAYDVANPKLGTFFQKLGNDIKLKCWQPAAQGIPLMKWSVEGCPAIQNIVESVKTLDNARMSSVILKIKEAADKQLEDEFSAIVDNGPYVLAPHAMKYFHEDSEWTQKTSKEKSKTIDGLRRRQVKASK